MKHINFPWRFVAVRHEARYRIAASVCCTSKNALGIEKAVQIAGQVELAHTAAVRREYAVGLGGDDEVVLMHSLDLLGLQRDRRIAPNRS